MNRIFERNRKFLEEAGWFISEPYSFEWWGKAESAEEIFISAILVQRSKWENVKIVLEKLKRRNLMDFNGIAKLEEEDLEEILKPIGLRKVKARRIINIARRITEIGGVEGLRNIKDVRRFLLSLEGLGKETVDSIMLFALNLPTFPVSNYVRRIFKRMRIISEMGYERIRNRIVQELNRDIYELKLLYSGITSVGKIFCKRKPKCETCILREIC